MQMVDVSSAWQCDIVALQGLNNCEALELYMPCHACQSSIGADQVTFLAHPISQHQCASDGLVRLITLNVTQLALIAAGARRRGCPCRELTWTLPLD